MKEEVKLLPFINKDWKPWIKAFFEQREFDKRQWWLVFKGNGMLFETSITKTKWRNFTPRLKKDLISHAAKKLGLL